MSQTASSDTASGKTGPSETGPAWVGWVQIGVIIAVIALSGLITLWLASSDDGNLGAAPAQPAAPVRVVTPQETSYSVTVETTGTVSVTAFVPLTPQVGGRIISVADTARAGAQFEADTVLFTIDPRDYQVAVSRARASLADARSALQQEEAQTEIARNEWESLNPGQPITPLAAREPQLNAARARRIAAEADLAQAQLNLERTEVSLPFNGRITESRLEPGILAVAGQSLGAAYDLASVEIVAPVAPSDLARLGIAEGRLATIQLEGASAPLAGIVDRVGAELDGRTRFVDVFIRPLNPQLALRPGLFADVVIDGPEIDRALIVPAAAAPGLDAVRVVDNGVIAERDVTVLDRARDYAVLAPFDFADGVIVSALPEGAVGRDADIVARVEE